MFLSYKPSHIAVVIPTNRLDRVYKALRTWSNADVDPRIAPSTIVFVADGIDASLVTRTIKEGPYHRDIKVIVVDSRVPLGDWQGATGDSACRSTGLLEALNHVPSNGMIITVDDDCYPHNLGEFIQHHWNNLYGRLAVSSSINVRVRGMPLSVLDGYEETRIKVGLSVGLWDGCLDRYAIDRLADGPRPMAEYPLESRLVHPAETLPICFMNMAIRPTALRYLLPAPMGIGTPYKRFDDIWGGLAFQYLARRFNIAWTLGLPVIIHDCASDPFQALKAELPGLEVNNHVWKALGTDNRDGNKNVFNNLAKAIMDIEQLPKNYRTKWAYMVVRWVEACNKIMPTGF